MAARSNKPTAMDVARLSGVSHMTVSRVFSGRDAVADATRERVLKVAHQLGYRPNQVARSLVQARTRTLGVVTLHNLWFRDMLIGAEEMARERGFGLIETSASVDPKVEQERVEVLLRPAPGSSYSMRSSAGCSEA